MDSVDVEKFYNNGDEESVIVNTVRVFVSGLKTGFTLQTIFTGMEKCCVKIPDLNMAMFLAMKIIDDRYLNEFDKENKKRVLKKFNHTLKGYDGMIEELKKEL